MMMWCQEQTCKNVMSAANPVPVTLEDVALEVCRSLRPAEEAVVELVELLLNPPPTLDRASVICSPAHPHEYAYRWDWGMVAVWRTSMTCSICQCQNARHEQSTWCFKPNAMLDWFVPLLKSTDPEADDLKPDCSGRCRRFPMER